MIKVLEIIDDHNKNHGTSVNYGTPEERSSIFKQIDKSNIDTLLLNNFNIEDISKQHTVRMLLLYNIKTNYNDILAIQNKNINSMIVINSPAEIKCKYVNNLYCFDSHNVSNRWTVKTYDENKGDKMNINVYDDVLKYIVCKYL
jgi:hypothetical protein